MLTFCNLLCRLLNDDNLIDQVAEHTSIEERYPEKAIEVIKWYNLCSDHPLITIGVGIIILVILYLFRKHIINKIMIFFIMRQLNKTEEDNFINLDILLPEESKQLLLKIFVSSTRMVCVESQLSGTIRTIIINNKRIDEHKYSEDLLDKLVEQKLLGPEHSKKDIHVTRLTRHLTELGCKYSEHLQLQSQYQFKTPASIVPDNFDDLPDAASDLIVSVLFENKSIYVENDNIFFGNLSSDSKRFFFDVPENVPLERQSEILDELVQKGLLSRDHNKYTATTTAIEAKENLILRDNKRIVDELLPPSRHLLKFAGGNAIEIRIEYSSTKPVSKVYASAKDNSRFTVLAFPVFDVNRTILILQKNYLVEKWDLAESIDSPTFSEKFKKVSSFDFSIENSKKKNFLIGKIQNYDFIVSHLTERGRQISKMLS